MDNELAKKIVLKSITGGIIGYISFKTDSVGAIILTGIIEPTVEYYFDGIVDKICKCIVNGRILNFRRWSNGKCLSFVGANDNLEGDDDRVVKLPLKPSIWNSDEDWVLAVSALKLAKKRFTRNTNPRKQKHIKLNCKGITISAGVLVGYTFHWNTHVSLFYEYMGVRYGNSKNSKRINFSKTLIPAKFSSDEKDYVDLCLYIYANKDLPVVSAFDRYIEEERGKLFENPYVIKYISQININEDTDLTSTAKYINEEIRSKVEEIENEMFKKPVQVHLFINSFIGFATVLGTQLTQNFPIALYDFNGSAKTYKRMIVLSSELLNS